MEQKTRESIRLVILMLRFDPKQSFVQCLIFWTYLTNLTNLLSRN